MNNEEWLEEASQLASEVCYPLENFSGSRRAYRKGFKDGAKLQKEKMMKEAVESYQVEDGRIEIEGNPLPCINPIIILPYPKFNPGDKVKLVIIKED